VAGLGRLGEWNLEVVTAEHDEGAVVETGGSDPQRGRPRVVGVD